MNKNQRRSITAGILLSLLFSQFSLMAQLGGQELRPGHYWDLDGQKHLGELKPRFGSALVDFNLKFISAGEKAVKVGKDEMQSFVWGTDSFTLITDFEVAYQTTYDSDFAQVIKSGKITLFRHYRKTGSSAYVGPSVGISVPINSIVSTYIVQKGADGYFIGVHNKKEFERYFLPLIADNEFLTQKILALKKRKWLEGLPAFVAEYNQSSNSN